MVRWSLSLFLAVCLWAPLAAQEADPAALAEMLKDDATRAALIAALEGAAPAEAPPVTSLTQDATGWARDRIEGFIARAARIPNTFALAGRAVQDGAVWASLVALLPLIALTYGAFFAVRAVFWRAGRIGLALAGLLGVGVGFGAASLWLGGNASLPALAFLNAFLVVEVLAVGLRLVLAPRRPTKRLVALDNRHARSLWRAGLWALVLLGYGQLFLVPVVEAEISIFVGRAVSTIIGAVAVLGLILWVLLGRDGPPAPEPGDTAVDEAIDTLVSLWHWPVLIYLIYLLIVVLTRPGNVLLPLLGSSLMIAAVVAIGFTLTAALGRLTSRRVVLPKAVAQQFPQLEGRLNGLLPAVLMTLRLLVLLASGLGVLVILGVLDPGTLISSETGRPLLARLAIVLALMAAVTLLWLVVASWIDFRSGDGASARSRTLLTLLKNAATIAIVLVATMIALAELGLNIAPLLASAGVLGLAISFGARRLVEDIITGIFIQFENGMNVGDVVSLGGVSGVVERLTVRSVRLRDVEGAVHVIPFSSAGMVTNYMRDYAYALADMGVGYGEDLAAVKSAMETAFDRLRADPETAPKIIGDLEWFGLQGFGPSAVTVRARIKTRPGDQWGVGRAYNAEVKRIFDEEGIEIPYPHQVMKIEGTLPRAE